jgi:predicted MFS family arabinose efflux permease
LRRAQSVLGIEGFSKLLIGQGVSGFGDWMATIAFMALANELTRSPAAVGGILLLRILPGAIGGPLGARVARRWGVRRTMLASDLIRALMVALVPLVAALWWIYMWAFLLEMVGLIFLPARDASIPELVKGTKQQTIKADSLILATSYGSIPVAAGAFALLAAILPVAGSGSIAGPAYVAVFWADALTYLVSFEAIRRIRELRAVGAVSLTKSTGADSSEPFLAAFRIPLVRAVMIPTFAVVIGLGALFSSGLVFAHEVLRATDAEFGALIALFGLGAFIGLGALQLRRHDGVADIRKGVTLVGLTVLLISTAVALPLAYLAAVGFGAGAAYVFIAAMTILQTRLEGYERVLAFSAFHVVIRIGLGLGAVGAGAVGALLDHATLPLAVEPSRLVLLCSALLVLASTAAVREERHAKTGVALHNLEANTGAPIGVPLEPKGSSHRAKRAAVGGGARLESSNGAAPAAEPVFEPGQVNSQAAPTKVLAAVEIGPCDGEGPVDVISRVIRLDSEDVTDEAPCVGV